MRRPDFGGICCKGMVINMKIVTCYKLTPVNDQIAVNKDRTLCFDKAEWEIGAYDLNAVEAGVSLAAQTDGIVTALTVGGEIVTNSKLKKAILSRGPAEMYAINCEGYGVADSFGTASLLKAAVEDMGGVELILCGEGSVDQYSQQVGVMLGTLLGWNNINAVNSLEYKDGKLLAERVLENETEHIEISLPAVISVTTSINKPRIPSMKDILGAGKKPSVVKRPEDLGADVSAGIETLDTLAPTQADRRCEIFEDAGVENIRAFFELIIKAI